MDIALQDQEQIQDREDQFHSGTFNHDSKTITGCMYDPNVLNALRESIGERELCIVDVDGVLIPERRPHRNGVISSDSIELIKTLGQNYAVIIWTSYGGYYEILQNSGLIPHIVAYIDGGNFAKVYYDKTKLLAINSCPHLTNRQKARIIREKELRVSFNKCPWLLGLEGIIIDDDKFPNIGRFQHFGSIRNIIQHMLEI